MLNALSISPATQTPALVAPPAPRGICWIDVATAVQRSGLSKRQITRLCGDEWYARGLARLAGSSWTIREDADSRIARVQFPDYAAADLRHLSDAHRKLLFWKKQVIAEWETFSNADQFRGIPQEEIDRCFLQLLANGRLAVQLLPGMKSPPSDRTLRNWRKQLRAGLLGLADGRSTRYQDEPPTADPFFEFFKDVYLVQQKPDIRFCWKMACFEAGRRGWMPRSEPQTRRFVSTIPKAVIDLRRGGPKAYNDKASPYIERDYSGLKVNQIWTADHHQFDVIVTHEGKETRPWLTAFQDVRSRKIVGYEITADGGNTNSILAAMAIAMDGHGVPEGMYFDWGKDFASQAIGGVKRKQRMAGEKVDPNMISMAVALDIRVVHCQPYHGQSKPIERGFGTMRQFSKTWSTYCGNSTANKPENLQAKLKRGAAAELADFIESFGRWAQWHNECHEHHGHAMEGKSPAVVFDELVTEKRVIPAAIRTIMFWKPGPLTKVGRNGVRCNGLTYGLNELALMMHWQGKEVSVRVDPNETNRAAICAPDGKFICMAECNQKLPWNATAEQTSKAIAAIKRRKKEVAAYHANRPRMMNNVADEMWQQQADRSRQEREARQVGVPLVTVSTPMNAQLPQIQRSLGQRGPAGPGLPGPGDDAATMKALSFRDLYRDRPFEDLPEDPPHVPLRVLMNIQSEERESEDRKIIDDFFELGKKFAPKEDGE
jgi:transposase InsO family protein